MPVCPKYNHSFGATKHDSLRQDKRQILQVFRQKKDENCAPFARGYLFLSTALAFAKKVSSSLPGADCG